MIDNINDLKKDLEENIKKCINNFKININKIYVGRISSSILDTIMVEYYGDTVPISKLTNSVVEGPRTLAITVFDHKIVKKIEKAILISNLGCTPISSLNVIRITLPFLTEDRRHVLIKTVRSEAEKSKISIRGIRRVSNDKIKNLIKNKKITKDDEHFFQNEIQNLTNLWIKKIDSVLKEKELELMKF